ncbi:hypothetical protein PRZ48_002438 [Zasmidium cellare]|uniref:USP domain-containing protein n=1 Tax=Zasmidium cellare TaxID=395010 RepID=A0ABR0F412_ZASCE|nr:hypothetical protein PRZ48_002438 [Zasmidium cellare]
MAPYRAVAQLPAQPLTEDGIVQLQKEILDHQESVQSHTKDHEKTAADLAKYERRLRQIQAGKAEYSEKYTLRRINTFKTTMYIAKAAIEKEERMIKFKQNRIDTNEEVAKAYNEAEAVRKAKWDAAKEARLNPVHPLFGRRLANAPKPKITKRIPAVTNRPLPSKPTSNKDPLHKTAQDAGVKKQTSSSAAKKTVETSVREKVMSERAIAEQQAEKKTECANSSSKEGGIKSESLKSGQSASEAPSKKPVNTSTVSDSNSKAKKRKLTDCPSQEEQGAAKKARSSPEQTEEKIETKPLKKNSSNSSTAEGKEGESEASASKKRSAPSDDDNEISPPAKKFQQSSESDLAKAGDNFVPQKTTTSKALKSSGKKTIVANGQDVRVFFKEKNRPKGQWTTKTAGEAWVRGIKEPEHMIEASNPRSDKTNGDGQSPRGLLNPHNACFANSAIQALNAVLTDEQVETLRGDGDLSLFGVPYKKLMQTTDQPGKEPAGIPELRSNISMTAAMYGNVKVAPYLGQLLIDLRNGASHKSKKNEGEKFVSPVLFQQVFSYGCGESDARLRFRCSTQEDAQEYMMAVIDAVIEEGHAFMRDFFKITKTITKKCTACGLESVGEQADMAVSVTPTKGTNTVQEAESKTQLRLAEVLHGRLNETTRPKEYKCEKCGTSDAREDISSVTKLSDHIVVHVERSGSEKRKNEAAARMFKDETAIEWAAEGTQFQFDDAQYEVAAAIRHKGDKPTAGHYEAFVKQNGTWNQLDDKNVREAVTVQQMADGKAGQCAVFVLRKLLQ